MQESFVSLPETRCLSRLTPGYRLRHLQLAPRKHLTGPTVFLPLSSLHRQAPTITLTLELHTSTSIASQSLEVQRRNISFRCDTEKRGDPSTTHMELYRIHRAVKTS